MAAVTRAHSLSALMGQPVTPGMRIGLLGGSFNPAHEGHLHISLEALKRLKLDQIWWLVSPQNPLKPQQGMAPFEKRFASAKAAARHPALRVTDLEVRLGTQYTADTIRRLMELGPGMNFVWLMGADNFVQLPAWHDWEGIMKTIPVCVLARPGFTWAAPLGKAALRFAADRLPAAAASQLARTTAPAWVFLPIPLHSASSTHIRRQGKW